MKKILTIITLAVLISIAGGAWWLYDSLDALVASLIREYGTDITGVPVKLSSAKIMVADGTATLHNLVVGNPPGYKTSHALSFDEITMKLDIDSLTKNVIVIREISITQPDVSYEYAASGSNLEAIQQNINRYVSQNFGVNGAPRPEKPGKKLIIDNVYVKNGKIDVTAEILNGREVSIPLPELHLIDIGKRPNGASAGEVTKQILGGIMQGATKAVGGLNLGIGVDSLKKDAGAVADRIKRIF
jgi:uncharacterized protein involved in outer membrane biogenesis